MKKFITSLAVVLAMTFGIVAFAGCCGNPDEFANATPISQDDFVKYIEAGKDGEVGTEDDLTSEIEGSFCFNLRIDGNTFIDGIVILDEEGKITEANIFADWNVGAVLLAEMMEEGEDDEEDFVLPSFRMYIKEDKAYIQVGENRFVTDFSMEDEPAEEDMMYFAALSFAFQTLESLDAPIGAIKTVGNFTGKIIEEGEVVKFKVSGYDEESESNMTAKLVYTNNTLTEFETTSRIVIDAETSFDVYESIKTYAGTNANLPNLENWGE